MSNADNTPTLKEIRDCRNRHNSEPYAAFFVRCADNSAKGKKQLQCKYCGRWMWPEDRCAIFRVAATELDATKSRPSTIT